MACDILIDVQSKKYKDFLNIFKISVNTGRGSLGIDNFISSFPSLQARINIKDGDNELSIMVNRNKIYSDLVGIIDSSRLISSSEKSKLINKVDKLINLSDSTVEEIDVVTPEVIEEELPETEFSQHIVSVYGSSDNVLTVNMQNNYKDEIFNLLFYNKTTKTLINANGRNTILNNNIRNYKAEQFGRIARYLRDKNSDFSDVSEILYNDDGSVNMENYSRVVNGFEKYILNNDPDNATIGSLYSRLSNELSHVNDHIEQKKTIYGLLISLANENGLNVKTQSNLYEASHFTNDYIRLKQRILSDDTLGPWKNIAISYINQIDGAELIDAVRSYSKLVYFDFLLKESFGDFFNIDANGTYNYKENIANMRRGWTDSNDNSDYRTALYTKLLLSQVDMYRYGDGIYLNKREEVSTILASFRSLLDNLVSFSSAIEMTQINEKSRLLHDLALDIYSSPVDNFYQILNILFDDQLSEQTNQYTTHSTNGTRYKSGALNETEVNILYSVYRAIKPIYEARNYSPAARGYLNEIVGYAIRNVNQNNLSIDVSLGSTSVDVLSNTFRDQTTRMTVNGINTFATDRSLNERLNIRDKYRPEINDIEVSPNEKVSQMTLHLDTADDKYSISVVFGSSEDLFNRRAKAKYEFKDDGTLRRIKDDPFIIEKYYAYKCGAQLSDEDIFLCSRLDRIFDLIEDTIGYGRQLTSDQVVLNQYKYKFKSKRFDGFLDPFILVGARAMYTNNWYIGALSTRQDLLTVIQAENPELYYNSINNQTAVRAFRIDNNDLLIADVISQSNDGIVQFCEERLDYSGLGVKATVRSKQGTSLANRSLLRMLSMHKFLMNHQQKSDVRFLPDLDNIIKALGNMYYDQETTINYTTTPMGKMDEVNMLDHEIFSLFYSDGGNTVMFKPIICSDKEIFPVFQLTPETIGDDVVNLLHSDNTVEHCETLAASRFGEFYRNIALDTTIKLYALLENRGIEEVRNIFIFGQNIDAELRGLHERLLSRKWTRKALAGAIAKYNSLREDNERIYIEEVKDYIVVNDADGNSYVDINPLLHDLALKFSGTKTTSVYLRNQAAKFVANLQYLNYAPRIINLQYSSIDEYTGKARSESGKRYPTRYYNLISKFFTGSNSKERLNSFIENWVDPDSGRLIIAKQNGKNILYKNDDFDESKDFELNPLYEKYFYVNSLYGNYLRYAVVGSEVNHKWNNNTPLDIARTLNNVNEWNSWSSVKLTPKQFETLRIELTKYANVSLLHFNLELTSNNAVNNALNWLADATMDFCDATAQNSQDKRNQAITTTIVTPILDNVHGVLPNMLVACSEDEGAVVWDGYGNQTDVSEVNDGSDDITVLQALLENISYGPSYQFGINRKPSIFENNGGTSTFIKSAAFTMTNEKIANSRGNARRLDLRYKKMTNIKWTEDANMVPEDLNFRGLLNGKRLYYKSKGGDIVEITDFGFVQTDANKGTDHGRIYYTEEYIGNMDAPTTVYHIFTYNGNHFRLTDITQAREMLDRSYESVNSIYDLTMALGGFDCVDANGLSSDFNYSVIVNLMENDAERKQQQYLDELEYEKSQMGDRWRPTTSRVVRKKLLKETFISYWCNLSAIKSGAKNVNPKSSWSNDESLQYFKVSTIGLGAAQNPENAVEGTDVSMFVQVVAASTLYGYTTDSATEIFAALARVGSPELSNQIETLLNSQQSTEEQKKVARSRIYDIVGRVMFVSRGYEKTRIQSSLIEGIKNTFNRYTNHFDDESKFPYSDPTIYKDFIAQVASLISSDAIRIRLAGMSNVQCPSYNIVQYYEFDGVKYFPNDILDLAREDYKNELISRLQERGVVYDGQSIFELEQTYRNLFGDNMPQYYSDDQDPTHMIETWKRNQLGKLNVRDGSWFVPGDAIDIYDANDNYIRSINLNTLTEYRRFKQDVASGQYNGFRLRNSVIVPCNLRPTIHRWRIKDGTYMNIFDLPFINETVVKDNQYYEFVQQAIETLYSQGYFMDANGNAIEIDRNSLEFIPGDIVSSYQNFGIFDIPKGVPLSTILREGEGFFRAAKFPKAPVNNIYDMVFMRGNGRHTMVTIGLPGLDVIEDNNFINRCSLDNDGTYWFMQKKGGTMVPLFAAAKYVEENGVYYDSERDVFVKDGAVLNKDEYRFNGKSCERLHKLVRKSYVDVSVKNSSTPKGKPIYYVADISEYNEVYGKENGQQEMLKTLIGLYNTGKYSRTQLNINAKENIMIRSKSRILQDFLDYVSESDPEQVAINKIQKGLLAGYYNNKDREFIDAFNNALGNFHDNLARKKWRAFEASLEFVSAHIPTQSLQSFTAQKIAGFINTGLNTVYCSAFQTFIQNSDFDIDTAELIGQHVDDNGTYESWSPYFDYTSKELFALSRRLPMPRAEVIKYSQDGVDITNEANVLTNRRNGDNERFLRALISALNKIHATGNTFSCASNVNSDALATVLNKHEMFVPSENSIRNLISTNIYNVSSDLRNYVVSNIPVSVAPLMTFGERSALSGLLNMANSMNPVSNIFRTSDKIKGKQCVSVTSNGLKFWCYFYYHNIQMLMNNKKPDIHVSYKGIVGRARGLTGEVKTINTIPDIPVRLLQPGMSSEFANVAVMLSTLIQGAADNTKNNTLTRINATPDLVKMHIYMTQMGFDIEDVIAFMICPASNAIVQFCGGLKYEYNDQGIYSAMPMARGAIPSQAKLYGNYFYQDEETGEYKQMTKNKHAENLLNLRISSLSIEEQNKIIDIQSTCEFSSSGVSAAVEPVIKYLVLNNDENAISAFFDDETLQDKCCRDYFNYCKQAALTILKYARLYKNGNEQYFNDIYEFSRIYNDSDEMSNVTVGFYSLNKGVKGDLDNILQSLNKIGHIVSFRESALGINRNNMFGLNRKVRPEINNDYIIKNRTWLNVLQKIRDSRGLEKISDPVQMVQDIRTQQIINELKWAESEGIISNFSPFEMITNDAYRNKCQRYYETIKSFTNAIELVYENDFFNRVIKEFNNLLAVTNISSVKNRIVFKYLNQANGNTRTLSTFADKLVTLEVLKEFEPVKIRKNENGIGLFNGFDAAFNRTLVDSFNMSDLNEIAGFVNFVTTDFFRDIKIRFANNSAIKHLTKLISNGRIMLSMDINLNDATLNPQGFFEIVNGMSELANYKYSGNYSYADILQLYSIIINNNSTGDTRLTNAFMNYENGSVMDRYFKALGQLDWSDVDIDAKMNDVLLNLATRTSKRNGTRKGYPYIICKDKQVGGNVLYVLNTNARPYRYMPKQFFKDAVANRNFITYSPILLDSAIDPGLDPVDKAFDILETDDTALREVLSDLEGSHRIMFQNDNGTIKIGMFGTLNEEDTEDLVITDDSGSHLTLLFQDIGQSQSTRETPSLRTIISCIKNMDAVQRMSLRDCLKSEYSNLRVQNAVANGEFINNMTFKQLAEWAGNNHIVAQDNYNIVYAPNGCIINGQSYRGRIVYKGDVYYIITNPSDATRFLSYVKTVEYATNASVIKYCNDYNSLSDEDKTKYYDAYDFYGYNTQYVLTPLTGKIFDTKGRYNGWYIYTDGKMFYIAPTEISNNSFYKRFSNYNDAMSEIDNIVGIESIEKNCLISIKQPLVNTASVSVESDMAHNGMLISALDTHVINIKIKDLPDSYREMFKGTLSEFKKKCGSLVKPLENAEQAAVFMYKLLERVPDSANDIIGTIKSKQNREMIINLVNEVVNLPTCYYRLKSKSGGKFILDRVEYNQHNLTSQLPDTPFIIGNVKNEIPGELIIPVEETPVEKAPVNEVVEKKETKKGRSEKTTVKSEPKTKKAKTRISNDVVNDGTICNGIVSFFKENLGAKIDAVYNNEFKKKFPESHNIKISDNGLLTINLSSAGVFQIKPYLTISIMNETVINKLSDEHFSRNSDKIMEWRDRLIELYKKKNYIQMLDISVVGREILDDEGLYIVNKLIGIVDVNISRMRMKLAQDGYENDLITPFTEEEAARINAKLLLDTGEATEKNC